MFIFRRYHRFFAAIPVFYWPIVWLQIARILAFTRQTGRKVLFTFTPRGRVIIKYVADAPLPPSQYRYSPPAVPRWLRPAAATDMPGGQLHVLWSLRAQNLPNKLDEEYFFSAHAVFLPP